MKKTKIHSRLIDSKNESGAALVTVVLVSLLLLTACIGMLSAVGSNSRNSTDVLSEAKAYYAAETGLQATINELRYDCSATYSAAKADPDMSTWLPYNVTAADGTSAVVIGQAAADYLPRTGSAYAISVTDPDNIGGRTDFNTVGKFQDTVIVGNTVVPITVGCGGKCITYGTSPNQTTIYVDDPPQASNTITFPYASTDNPPLTTFRIENEVGGTGSPITDNLRFEVSYRMTFPSAAAKTIIGSITKQTNVGDPISATFNAREYTLKGSYINMCNSADCVGLVVQGPCANPRTTSTYSVALPPNATTTVYANITPVEPTRILVKSTGFGPNRSLKKLEAIIKRDFFEGLGSSPAISMIGPSGPGFRFEPGTSTNVSYSGVSGPSFGLTNQSNLDYVANRAPGCNPNEASPCGDQSRMTPPPALISDVPSWQQTPVALDALVQELKTVAQGSGTYYSGGGTLPFPPGDFSNGTGITFCEGNCQVGGSGGGILVVTGKLTNTGGFSFKGLILVTGAGGWDRNGGGNGLVTGNIVIAPYNEASLTCTPQTGDCFLPPQYYISGGGGSDVVFSELGPAFDGTSAATDFVQGVAEK